MERNHRLAIALGILVFAAALSRAEQEVPHSESALEAALSRHGIATASLGPEAITSWSALAHDIAVAEDQFLTFKGQRALAMMHLAMHDALNGIVRVYDAYAFEGSGRFAHPIAAAAQAAHDVLLSQYPDRQATVSDQLARWLAGVPGGALRERGIALGRDAAAAILAKRDADGWDVQGSYDFDSSPGRYKTTPPWNGFVAQPGFRFAKPFVLEQPSQFRPSPPPLLTSSAYARAFQEVKEYGAADSSRRTDEQTAYALWWMEFAEGSVNRLARRLVTERKFPLWQTARLFAHIGVALFDTYVATWDAKYEYDHWRPYTAVRAADTDGNPRTIPDATWEPLRPTPPFPEYTSAHAAACAASFEVLEQVFGRRLTFAMDTTTAPAGMPTRRFDSFQSAAAECADSRVRLGWHFRYATDAGIELGRQIGRYAQNHSLRKKTRAR